MQVWGAVGGSTRSIYIAVVGLTSYSSSSGGGVGGVTQISGSQSGYHPRAGHGRAWWSRKKRRWDASSHRCPSLYTKRYRYVVLHPRWRKLRMSKMISTEGSQVRRAGGPA